MKARSTGRSRTPCSRLFALGRFDDGLHNGPVQLGKIQVSFEAVVDQFDRIHSPRRPQLDRGDGCFRFVNLHRELFAAPLLARTHRARGMPTRRRDPGGPGSAADEEVSTGVSITLGL
jgi:hypothetical protein